MSQVALALRLRGYVDLLKPRLIFLVILSAMTGFYLAQKPGHVASALWSALLGITLVSAGSMALNQWLERAEDKKMVRTQKRPLPAGVVTPLEALLMGLGLSAAGLWVLVAGQHAAAAILAGVTLVLYIVVYTPLKKITLLCTIVGAIPGALPTLAGWAAVEWPFSERAWILFVILYLWQMPHFYAISWIWREDYVRAGFKMLSVNDPTGQRVARHILFYVLALLPVSLLPVWIGMAGWVYGAGAVALGFFFLWRAIQAFGDIQRYARPVFHASIIYLSALLILLIVDKQ
ncbi:MAG: heme o synthase [Candidatus Omnitrophica bacterium]|nr:heme o synthase [Candidatus Omnitrophota bacterium]